jgi:hypothetical protein
MTLVSEGNQMETRQMKTNGYTTSFAVEQSPEEVFDATPRANNQ